MVDERKLSDLGICDVAGAAALKGVAARTVQRWIEDGRIPAYPIGEGRYRKYLLVITDVEAFAPAPKGRPVGSGSQEPEPEPAPKPKAKRGRPKKAK